MQLLQTCYFGHISIARLLLDAFFRGKRRISRQLRWSQFTVAGGEEGRTGKRGGTIAQEEEQGGSDRM